MKRFEAGGFVVWEPGTRRERARGLLGRDGLPSNEALFLRDCRSVHTFGMRFALDVVLLASDMQPVAVTAMKPGRLLFPRRGVRHILEVAAGRGLAAAQEIHWPVPGAGPVDTHRSPRRSTT